MSHFTVGVITKSEPNEFDIEKALDDYDENKDVITIISKERFIKNRRQDQQRYKESPGYQAYLNNPEEYKKDANQGHINYLENVVPKLFAMSDEELYQYEIEDIRDSDIQDDGSIIDRYNPKAKWDWWVIGGRWNHTIPTKDQSNVNTTKISNIDFEPKQEELDQLNRHWDVMVNKHEPKEDTETYIFGPSAKYLEETFKTKENYIKLNAGFKTYALVLPDRCWIEPGQMGWFGQSNKTSESELDYKDRFKKLMERYKDHYLTIIDCHI